MHLAHVLPVFAGLTSALVVQPRQSQPTGVQITQLAYSGNGCTASSAAGPALTDVTTWTVPMKIYKAESGANNTRVAETKVNCQQSFTVTHPAGWQFSVNKADYYGRVQLGQGAEAISTTTYSFTGDAKTLSSRYYFDGPFSGLYFRNDRYTAATGLWSKCGTGATLNINTEVKVGPLSGGSTRPASMEAFNPYGGKIGVAWRKCT
ncbi:hypothetical protein OQA88_10527 [Cercophora sp. LCS_1]